MDSTLCCDIVAGHVALSSLYFGTLFKTHTNYSFWDYLLSYRIDRAADLLTTGDKEIGEILLECGFNSKTNFNRRFLKKQGVTPSQFRQRRRYGDYSQV